MTAPTAVTRRPEGIGFRRLYPHRPETVFDAFADPVKLARWWGPRECPVVECSLDFRVGGIWHYRLMSSRTGQSAWSRAVFEDIVAPHRIVFVETSSDASGAVTLDRGPAHTTVTLTPHADGTLVAVEINHFSADEADLALARGIERGFARALDQLETVLNHEWKE